MSNRPHGKGFYQGPGIRESAEDAELATVAEHDGNGIAVADSFSNSHLVEQNVWRELHLAPGGQFLSLTVRRMHDCVYLHGVLEVTDKDFPENVDNLVKRVASVNRVLNHLVMLESRAGLPD